MAESDTDNKIAASGELAPSTNKNATQIQFQAPSGSWTKLCSRFEQEERRNSEFHWIV